MFTVHRNFFAILILQTILVASYRPYFKMTKIECKDVNKNIIRLNVCRLKAINRDVVEATVRASLLQPVNNCNLHTELLRKYNYYQPFFINHTFDACAFLKTRKNSFYFDILFKLIDKFTNMNHTCPYEGEFIVERFRPLHKNLLLPLPTGDYLIKFEFYTLGIKFFNLHVWFGFKELENNEVAHRN